MVHKGISALTFKTCPGLCQGFILKGLNTKRHPILHVSKHFCICIHVNVAQSDKLWYQISQREVCLYVHKFKLYHLRLKAIPLYKHSIFINTANKEFVDLDLDLKVLDSLYPLCCSNIQISPLWDEKRNILSS